MFFFCLNFSCAEKKNKSLRVFLSFFNRIFSIHFRKLLDEMSPRPNVPLDEVSLDQLSLDQMSLDQMSPRRSVP